MGISQLAFAGSPAHETNFSCEIPLARTFSYQIRTTKPRKGQIRLLNLVRGGVRLGVVPLSLSPSRVHNLGEKNGEKRVLITRRISLGYFFFLAVFFRFTHDGVSERGTDYS